MTILPAGRVHPLTAWGLRSASPRRPRKDGQLQVATGPWRFNLADQDDRTKSTEMLIPWLPLVVSITAIVVSPVNMVAVLDGFDCGGREPVDPAPSAVIAETGLSSMLSKSGFAGGGRWTANDRESIMGWVNPPAPANVGTRPIAKGEAIRSPAARRVLRPEIADHVVSNHIEQRDTCLRPSKPRPKSDTNSAQAGRRCSWPHLTRCQLVGEAGKSLVFNLPSLEL